MEVGGVIIGSQVCSDCVAESECAALLAACHYFSLTTTVRLSLQLRTGSYMPNMDIVGKALPASCFSFELPSSSVTSCSNH